LGSLLRQAQMGGVPDSFVTWIRAAQQFENARAQRVLDAGLGLERQIARQDQTTSPLQSLPQHIHVQILRFLDTGSLQAASASCFAFSFRVHAASAKPAHGAAAHRAALDPTILTVQREHWFNSLWVTQEQATALPTSCCGLRKITVPATPPARAANLEQEIALWRPLCEIAAQAWRNSSIIDVKAPGPLHKALYCDDRRMFREIRQQRASWGKWDVDSAVRWCLGSDAFGCLQDLLEEAARPRPGSTHSRYDSSAYLGFLISGHERGQLAFVRGVLAQFRTPEVRGAFESLAERRIRV
jgi:hypothetical protein